MTAITRRDAVLGAAAVAVAGVPTAVAVWSPSPTAFAGAIDPVIAAAGHWHTAFDRTLEQSEWWVSHQNPNLDELKQDPGLAQKYEEHRETLRVAGKAVSDARKQLLTKAPVTVAGAVALLGCATRIMVEQRRARQNPCPAGSRARIAFCVLDGNGHEAMVLAAQRVLERLAGEVRS